MAKFELDPSKLLAAARAKSETIKQKAKTIKPKAGQNRYILLPGWEGDRQQFFHDFGMHWIKDDSDEIKAVYPCLERIYNKPCPVCEQLNAAIRASTSDDQTETLKKAVSRQSYLLNVLALDDTANATTPQILEISKMAFGALLEQIEEWGTDIFDSENPRAVIISREGTGLTTKYTVSTASKKQAIDADDIYPKINNLADYVRQENEEQLRRSIGAINANAGLLSPSNDTPSISTIASVENNEALAARRAQEAATPSGASVALDDELDALLALEDLDDATFATGT